MAVALEAGADAIGFVFANSPRRVSVDLARRITRDLPAHVVKVAVMYHPTQTEWDEVAAGFRPDWLQTEAADFIRLTVDQSVVHMPVFRDAESLDADTVAALPQILFEASVSGVGQRANWNRAADPADARRRTESGQRRSGDPAGLALGRRCQQWCRSTSRG